MVHQNDARSVLCVGAATWDLVLRVESIPASPAKVLADACVETAAGTAASAALAIAALGGHARLLAALGDDATGARCRRELAERGVDASAVRLMAGARTALGAILVDAPGEHLACRHYPPELADAPPAGTAEAVQASDAVLCDVRWPDATEAALLAAHQLGKINVLEVDVAPPEVHARLVPAATNVVFARDALRAFTGRSDPEDALGALGAQGVARFGCVGVTLGEDGFLGLADGRLVQRPAPPPPGPIVDTLAARDVFSGALALRLAEGETLEGAIDFALAAATLKCTHFGGNRGAPSRPALEAFVSQLRRTHEL